MDELSAERFRVEMNEKLNTFLLSTSNETLSFPPCRSFQRSLIHKESAKLGLSAKSKGKGDTRHVVVSKPYIPLDQYAALLSNAKRAQQSNTECGVDDAIATTSFAANRKTFNCDFEMNLETAHLFRESDWMPKVPEENRFKKPPIPYDMNHIADEDLFKLQTDFQKS
uniref:R3H domain-containing protein n=1 Tax=Romanomermis culicivorax TaxID=13658 RepID=A0A915KB92_ROMCU